MPNDELGKKYPDGVVIVTQGSSGDCLYVIQAGQVEVYQEVHGVRERLAVLGEGDFFGEVPLLERKARSATVRVIGEARVLMVDRRNFARRVHEDPSLAYRVMEAMSHEIRRLAEEIARLKSRDYA